MATYYVGKGGNDGNAGTSWALRKLTLNGAEDIPVAAGDIVYVGPGVYREQLEVDVSGGAGSEILYVADVTGQWTDGVGGIVRITGSDNDQTAARTTCIAANNKDYRISRGFTLDGASTANIHLSGGCSDWTIEDCAFIGNPTITDSWIYINQSTPTNIVIRRCAMMGGGYGIYYTNGADTAASGCLIQNCLITGGYYGITTNNVSDLIIRNCTITGTGYGIYANSLNAGDSITIENCDLVGITQVALGASALGEIIEDYNNLVGNSVDRGNTAVGANSTAYLWLPMPPILYSGDDQLSGYKFPWWYGELSEWSQVRAITGNNEPAVDLRGMGRPAPASKNSWGAIQWQGEERDTGTTYDASTASVELSDAGRVQFKIPVDGTEITVSVRAYHEANYAGVLPQMVIKQPGQADRTTTDAGAAGAWNELTDTFTPAADPEYVFVELVSNNTAAAGNYATYFDNLAVDASPTLGEFNEWFTDRIGFDEVATGGGGIAAPGFSPSTGMR